MGFVKGHKHNDNWYKRMVGHSVSDKMRNAISKAQNGRKHQIQEGFQKGHLPIQGTEKTRFKKGLTPWNKGKGKGTDKNKLKYRTYKATAKKRGLLFEIPFEEFKEMINSQCYYCSEPATGVDRVDNTMGYIKGNCVPCCGICNHMKWNLTQEDFINKCKEIANKI